MNFEDIKLDYDTLLTNNNVSSFFHYGMDWEESYKKIDLIEKSLQVTHEKLVSAIREKGNTHSHKKNMAFTFMRLTEMYRMAFTHEIGYYCKSLAKVCLHKFENNKELIKRIYEIIMYDGLTHWEHNILLRPYMFDFENMCNIHNFDKHSYLRKELKEKIIKKIVKLLEKDSSLKCHLDSRIYSIFNIEMPTES